MRSTLPPESERPATSRLRSVLHELIASRAEIEASEERKETQRSGCTAVGQLVDRRRAEVSGVLRSVTLRPSQNVPALEAELYDGSGSLHVVWLGQRRIAGIEPGRRARLAGLVCVQDGRPTMYNPRYELAPRPGE
ncbi:OB-fold nucleic acid binding domain-containing protein [Cellulomonas sp. KRMCY2]|uniref:OB-fold nucleic acid binding domain-containing protein n=1 Tax=Cellulomonas sp. KRMCY2 TaxID=1304865 RepID=UPI0004BCA919|nr:OB-fold nucleic acid binding domain-containing protein [Cellulomonas sp. KRMCY2]